MVGGGTAENTLLFNIFLLLKNSLRYFATAGISLILVPGDNTFPFSLLHFIS